MKRNLRKRKRITTGGIHDPARYFKKILAVNRMQNEKKNKS